MALIACGECGREVSDKAVSCPQCGAPINRAEAIPVKPQQQKKNVGCFTALVVIVGTLWLVGKCAPTTNTASAPRPASAPAVVLTAPQILAEIKSKWDPNAEPAADHANMLYQAKLLTERHAGTPEAAEAQKLIEPLAAKVEAFRVQTAARVAERKWTYRSDTDPMTGAKRGFASIESTNTIELEFPYQGAQRGTLLLRKQGSELDVLFSIREGQIQCGYQECTISARFDEAAPTTFRMLEPSDNSTETLFFSDPKRFLAKMDAAKTVRLQIVIFHGGTHTFEFDVAGFRQDLLLH